MFGIGQVCVKTAGRDAKKICVVVDVVDDKYVLIDGQTRRRKCNIIHLEPLGKKAEIKKNATNKEVVEALGKIGIKCEEKKDNKEKKDKTERPVKKRVLRAKEKESSKKEKGKKEDKEKKEKKDNKEKADKEKNKENE